MFNLIISPVNDTWRMAVGETGSSHFPLSRLFDSTKSEIATRFQPISDKLINISQLPVLFITEMYENAIPGDSSSYVNVRLGRIFNLVIKDSSVCFSFYIQQDFGCIEILGDDENIYSEVLETGAFGLSRSLWAIKNGAIFEVLSKLNLIQDPLNESEPLYNINIKSDYSSLTFKKSGNSIVNSLKDYLSEVLSAQVSDMNELFFRGHADATYKAEPSLLRRDKQGNYLHLMNEATMVRELLTVQPAEFESDHYMIDKLVRMQHYGLPTRLLDITSNPLIALYFACCENKFDDQGNEMNGQVLVFTALKKNVKYFDSDTISILSNLSLLSDELKNSMDRTLSIEEFNETIECQHLLHFIKNEKSYFKSVINPEHISKSYFVKGRVSNARISSQSGAFLLFGIEPISIESGVSGLKVKRIEINHKQKKDILKDLAKLNIKESTVFPGIEMAAREISEKYKGRSEKDGQIHKLQI